MRLWKPLLEFEDAPEAIANKIHLLAHTGLLDATELRHAIEVPLRYPQKVDIQSVAKPAQSAAQLH